MTQDEKDLLLKDLCGRLPYGIVVHIDPHELNDGYCDIDTVKLYPKDAGKLYRIIERGVTVKPYLFPMSSMTEEQSKIYHELVGGMFGTGVLINLDCLIVFLNRNYLDWRGLIPLGLAIDATGKNIY